MSWPTRKRRDLSISEKIDLLKKYDELPKSISQRQAAENLQISQPLLSKLLKNRYDVETSFMNDELCRSRKRKRSGKDGEVETALKEWFLDAQKEEVRIDGTLLKQKAEELALRMGKEDFQVTNGWFTRWKYRENVTYHNHATHLTVDSDLSVTESRLSDGEWISALISEYSAENTYSAHETALYCRALPEHTQNAGILEAEMDAERITVLCCASMNGKKNELVVVGKKKQPHSFEGVKSLPVRYYANVTAHMTTAIFSDWIHAWDDQLERKILLLVNDSVRHLMSFSLKNIRILSLPLRTSFNPIIHTLKAYYRHEMRNLCSQRTVNDVGSSLVKRISLLDVVHLLAASWHAVTESTIRICFKRGGFLDHCEDKDEIQSVPLPNDLTLNQYDQWMSIDSNLKTFGYSEEPICSGMTDCTNGDELGEEKYAIENSFTPAPPPSHQEMCNALDVLNRAVQYYGEDFNSHYSYVNYIKRMMEKNKKQTETVNNFFRSL